MPRTALPAAPSRSLRRPTSGDGRSPRTAWARGLSAPQPPLRRPIRRRPRRPACRPRRGSPPHRRSGRWTRAPARSRSSSPPRTGQIRVKVIVWSASRFGTADADIAISDPVAVTLPVPSFLRPDDRSDLTLAIDNADGPRGDYRLSVKAEGAITLQGDPGTTMNLAEHEQRSQPISIQAAGPGDGRVVVAVEGPQDIRFERTYPIAVRPPERTLFRHATITLKPGAVLSLDPASLAPLKADFIRWSPAAPACSTLAGSSATRRRRVCDAARRHRHRMAVCRGGRRPGQGRRPGRGGESLPRLRAPDARRAATGGRGICRIGQRRERPLAHRRRGRPARPGAVGRRRDPGRADRGGSRTSWLRARSRSARKPSRPSGSTRSPMRIWRWP